MLNTNQMRSWLTTRHPYRRADDDSGWNIYVRGRPSPEPAQGDHVFFYETFQGPRGMKGLPRGRQGVVRAGEVAGASQASDVDGWPVMYPCQRHRRFDTIPMEQVLRALGRGGMRIRGGLLELTPEQADQLRALAR
jgi:hypothetical protein